MWKELITGRNLEHINDILLSVKREPKTPARIIRETHLGSVTAYRLIKESVDRGLLRANPTARKITNSKHLYSTTDKGLEFLKSFREIKECLGENL